MKNKSITFYKLLYTKNNVLKALFSLCLSIIPITYCYARAKAKPMPFRFVAIADVIDLTNGSYAVYEFLDIYNEDNNKDLVVYSVKADSWVGRRVVRVQEEWLGNSTAGDNSISNVFKNGYIIDNQLNQVKPLVIPPMTKIRAVQRQRVVTGYPLRNWWVRWLRFTVYTNYGVFQSNFISSPMKPPTVIVSERLGRQLDDLSSPPGHTKAPKKFIEPWQIYPFSDNINLTNTKSK